MAEAKRQRSKEEHELDEMREVRPIGHKAVLESPLSVIKMDTSELHLFTSRLNDFLNSPGAAAIRICECCIQVS